jgi:predicted CXXCH cytochrome family protein
MSGTAFANWGPHGGYGTFTDSNSNGLADPGLGEINPDTDACAGCHRAHTAVSAITWTDTEGGVKNALLIGTTAATLREFCYTCHGDAGYGAATNVQAGVYDNSNGRVGTDFNSTAGYGYTNSTFNATLNGGGFDDIGGAGASMTSWHEVSGATGTAWGGGTGTGPQGGTVMPMDCCTCHDPHGSSNYRILKDKVNNVTVGGYEGGIDAGSDPDPQPFIVSNEVGFPATGTNPGFRLHRNYGDLDNDGVGGEAGDYRPDYTTARYAQMVSLDTDKGMSGWCASCHTQYNTISANGQGAYNAADGYGFVTRHRHPVNQPLDTFYGDRSLIIDTTDANGTNTPWDDTIDIPLEHDPSGPRGISQVNDDSDYIGCLTCHRAHGVDATMEGYANSSSNIVPSRDTGSGGVPPASSSALLRADNRGVCERCHNK